MFDLKVDTSGALKVVGGMLHKIDHFKRVDIGTVLSDWQVEDMHRNRPFTLRSRARGRASTVIRPHSRYEVNRSRMAQRRLARRAKRKSFTGSAEYRKWSTRAILRAELFTALEERANEALHKLLAWKK
jgi:hypothetical protein